MLFWDAPARFYQYMPNTRVVMTIHNMDSSGECRQVLPSLVPPGAAQHGAAQRCPAFEPAVQAGTRCSLLRVRLGW